MTSYTHALTQQQVGRLRAFSRNLGFEFVPKPYTLFFAQKNKLSVAVYEKGPKVLIQGKGVEEFVQFEIEPKILEEAKLGYEEVDSPPKCSSRISELMKAARAICLGHSSLPVST